jgi:phage baseplate assembly protein W
MAILRQDFAYPIRIDVNAASQQTAQTSYPTHVDQMVRQLLLTAPGERVNLPQFGCGLRSLVFAANTDALVATVKLRVIQGLNQWLAGVVNVVDVVTTGPGDAATEPGTLEVTVTYTLVETQTNQAVTVTVA